MQVKPVCDVIMLAWNKRETTQQCVESYLKHTPLPTRLILIDNASNDDTPQYFASLKSTSACEIQVITNKQNNGFVGGMNQGIAVSTAPYVCLANNDLIFTDGWLEEMLAIFEKYPQVGLLNPNSNNLGAKIPRDRSVDDFAAELKAKNAGVFIEMPNCVGFCMCIPRKIVETVGGLSEEFHPMFFEDTDYSRKVSAAGYLIGLATGSYVWHEEHASMKQLSDAGESHFCRSRAVFDKKWGQSLRVMYIAPQQRIARTDLESCVLIARRGNQVTLAVRDSEKTIKSFFSEFKMSEHYGIGLFCYTYRVQLLLRMLLKKKKFHRIIVVNGQGCWFFLVKLLAAISGTQIQTNTGL